VRKGWNQNRVPKRMRLNLSTGLTTQITGFLQNQIKMFRNDGNLINVLDGLRQYLISMSHCQWTQP